MYKKNVNGLRYYEFESFPAEKVGVRFYTRNGGVSPAPWTSLNQGGTVGDARENVVENRNRIFKDLDRPVDSIFDVWQVHGNELIFSRVPRPLESEHQKADAIMTDVPEVTLFMRFADCVPIVIYAPAAHAVGIVHAGWMGTVNGIVKEVVKEFTDRFRITAKDLIAGIGPSIGPDHYQIGADVEQEVTESFGPQTQSVLRRSDGMCYFNLWRANEILLREVGVEAIEVAEICTACNTQDWYSHRQEKGKTGRFAAVAYLK
jgi:YfiH family protein